MGQHPGINKRLCFIASIDRLRGGYDIRYVNRKQFLDRLFYAGSSASLVLASCSKGQPDEPEPADDDILWTIDLSAQLQSVGDSIKDTQKGLFVKRIADGMLTSSFVCFSLYCSHAGCIVAPQTSGEFHCPCHGSKYAADGTVLQGPAPRALDKPVLQISGNKLLVKR